MLMNIPAETRRGEQLGVELALFNFHDERIEVPLKSIKKHSTGILQLGNPVRSIHYNGIQPDIM